jgi:hypothetical protein
MKTANILVPLLLLVIPLHSIHAQEVKHAPTVEQCRADQRLWSSKLEQFSGQPDPIWSISFKELMKWERELIDCVQVDLERRNEYSNTAGEIDLERAGRLMRFLHRHNLYDQFIAEDAQGKR